MTPLEKISPDEVENMIQQMAESLKTLLGTTSADATVTSAKMLGIKTGGVQVAQRLHLSLIHI